MCNTMNESIVYRAVMRGDVNEVERLLAEGYDYNRPDRHRITPLHIACRDGRVEIVRLLLTHGADPNVVTTNRKTPLMMACMNAHREIVDLLLENGTLEKETVYARDKDRNTAMIMLAGCHPSKRSDVIAIWETFKRHGYSIFNSEFD